MSFLIKARAVQYLDISEATLDDRVHVTLENDTVVVLKLHPTHKHELVVDKDASDSALVEQLAREAAQSSTVLRNALRPDTGEFQVGESAEMSIQEMVSRASLTVLIHPTREALDHSPLAERDLVINRGMGDGNSTGSSVGKIKQVHFE